MEAADRPSFLLAGTVQDQTSRPIPDIDVIVVGYQDPFGETRPETRVYENELVGQSFRTDDSGSFNIRLPTDREVFVRADPRPDQLFRADPSLVSSLWLTPKSDVRLVLRSAPLTTLSVRLVDEWGSPLKDAFRVSIRGHRWGVSTLTGKAGRAQTSVPLAWGGMVEIGLARPKASAKPVTLRIDPGQTYEVSLTLSGESVFSGVVLDDRGSPIPGAHVYLGSPEGDSDELLDIFNSSNEIGAQTDAGGRFFFRGPNSSVLTAEHPDYCPKTVALAESQAIVLGGRAQLTIRSTRRDLSQLSVALDDQPIDLSKSAELYRIDRIAGGLHVLAVQGLGELVLRIECGQEESLNLDTCFRMSIRIESEGVPFLQPRRGVLWGLEGAFSLVSFDLVDGTLIAEGVLPGAYVMAFEGGGMITFEAAPEVTLDVGSSRLRVHAPPGSAVCGLPNELGEIKELNHLARRASVEVPVNGFVDYWPLRFGVWRFSIVDSTRFQMVTIGGTEESVVLE